MVLIGIESSCVYDRSEIHALKIIYEKSNFINFVKYLGVEAQMDGIQQIRNR